MSTGEKSENSNLCSNIYRYANVLHFNYSVFLLFLICGIQVDDKAALVQQLDPKKDTPPQVSEILIRVATEQLMSISQTVSLVTIIIINKFKLKEFCIYRN